MAKLSFVQGRLSSEVAGRYQYFPIHNWKNEFYKAKQFVDLNVLVKTLL